MAKPKRKIQAVEIVKRDDKVSKYRDMVKAAYYSAASDSNTMDFSFASGVNMIESLECDLNILRNRIRYELRQNGPAKGLCRVYANACISTGPTLSVEVEPGNEAWAEEVEFMFSEWARSCGYTRGESLAELLHIGVRQFFTAGEYFALDKFDGSANGPLKLRVLQIRPERICNPYSFDITKTVQGIKFDNAGKPIIYYVRDENVAGQSNFKFIEESARNVRHVFYCESPEQVRGEPWLAAGLPDLHRRRRYDEARVAAAIVAAKFAIFITNSDPQITLDPKELLPDGVIDINDGAATILPPHYGVQSFSGAQPVAGAGDFRREMIANAGAAVGMSAAASTMDSRGNSFAGARYDDVGVGIEHEVLRGIIANRDLNPLASKVISEAVAVREIPTPPEWFRLIWRWPSASRHTDPGKAAQADQIRIASASDSFAQVWSEHGRSKEQSRAEILDDVKWFRDNGLIHPLDKSAQPKTQPMNQNDET